MQRLKYKRRRQFVSGRIQGRLMLHLGVYWVVYHVFLWHAMFLYRYAQLRTLPATPNSSLSLGQMYAQFASDNSLILVFAFVTLPIIVLDMMKMTHRIAGPLVRFQNVLRDLTAGKSVPPVKLRKGDLLTEFQAEFNKYLEHLAAERHGTGQSSDEEVLAEQVAGLRETIHRSAHHAESAVQDSLTVQH